jgi:hypothetical protein
VTLVEDFPGYIGTWPVDSFWSSTSPIERGGSKTVKFARCARTQMRKRLTGIFHAVQEIARKEGVCGGAERRGVG